MSKAYKEELYQHYKTGDVYKVIDIVKHTETLKDLVVYKSMELSSPNQVWARPLEMFEEVVRVKTKDVLSIEDRADYIITPRFQLVSQLESKNCNHKFSNKTCALVTGKGDLTGSIYCKVCGEIVEEGRI